MGHGNLVMYRYCLQQYEYEQYDGQCVVAHVVTIYHHNISISISISVLVYNDNELSLLFLYLLPYSNSTTY
jgi:hypothetical protein